MSTAVFDSAVAGRYDRYLRPLFFEPYAQDVAARLKISAGMRVLEIACGTGIVTRHLLGVLPGDATLVATDLSEQMLAIAGEQVSPDSRLAFQPADGLNLPFDDGSFDAVVCQFDLMFFPDKARGLREMRRVLGAGGQLLLTTWDSKPHNPVAEMADAAVRQLVSDSPPQFFEVPHHMHDVTLLERLVREAGFAAVAIELVEKDGHGATAHDAAIGAILGTPLAVQLADRSIAAEPIVQRLADMIRERFGSGPIDVPLKALIVSASA